MEEVGEEEVRDGGNAGMLRLLTSTLTVEKSNMGARNNRGEA